MKKIYYILTACLLFFQMCKPNDHCVDGGRDLRLNFYNNSDSNLYVMVSGAYPDTNSYNSLKYYETSHAIVVYVEKNENVLISVQCSWERYFESFVNSDTIMTFIILDEGQGRENLINNHTVIKRLNLTLDSLESMKWKIVYP